MQMLTVLGNLGKDVEERDTKIGKVWTFPVAVSLSKDEVLWYDCVVFPDRQRMLSSMHPYLTKGSRFLITGDFRGPELYKSRDGETKCKLKLWPLSIQFVLSKKEAEPKDHYATDITDQELPF